MTLFWGRMKVVAVAVAVAVATGVAAPAAEMKAGPPKAASAKLGSLRIDSAPQGARVFIRTGGHNGYAEVGVTPIALKDVEPGLLEYTLFRPDRQLYDGSLWVEAGKEHVEKAQMLPGRVFFIDQKHPRASNDNPGTEDSPWKDFEYARKALQAGDTVLFKAGRYRDPDTGKHTFKWLFCPIQSGRPEAPIVLRAYPGHTTTLGAGDKPELAIRIRTAHIIVDGFRIEGRIDVRKGKHQRVPGDLGGALKNCDLSIGAQSSDPSLNWGISLFTQDFRVYNNYVHDMAGSGNRGHNTACIMLFRPSSDCIVENNEADTGKARLVYSAFGQKGGGIFRNVWRRNIARNAAAGFLGMGATASNRLSGNNVCYQNVAVDCRLAFQLHHTCSGYRIFNNTAYNCDVFFGGGGMCDRSQVWNNVAVAKTGYSTGTWPIEKLLDLCDYNLFSGGVLARHRWRPYANDIGTWRRKTGWDAHSIVADPELVNGAAGDLRIRDGSPCIDAGRPVTYAVGSGKDAEQIEVKNEGRYGKAPIQWGVEPTVFAPLRLPFEAGDMIQIGKGKDAQLARIVQVVDRTHLKLDKKVSWKNGDWVTFPFEGEAPDIGAYEFGDARRIIGPTWKAYPNRNFSKR